MTRKLSIAFVHPDLGIGGAERLVVDAAISLKNRGHRVVIYTMHHDLSHCFEETRDGTLEVRVGGNWLVPPSINGRFTILCTVLRSLMLARKLTNDNEQYDIVFVDQLSAPIPLLKYARAHILFYCHFPDYLSASHDSFTKKLYRVPFDLLEEFTTGEADEILVNSRFTQETFRNAFPHLSRIPKVLMPALNLLKYDTPADMDDPSLRAFQTNKKIVLSINRFERKKDIGLAIDAFELFLSKSKAEGKQVTQASSNATPGNSSDGCCLIVAGGWDPKVLENTEYLKELDTHARRLGLCTRVISPQTISPEARRLLPGDVVSAPTILDTLIEYKDDSEASVPSKEQEDPLALVDVLFLPSFTENQRAYLLSAAKCVVYTPTNEHLGIVPLEAMYTRTPVVAVNSGGPRETVQNGKTGYLCEPVKEEFAMAIAKILSMSDSKRQAMANTGHETIKEKFSLDTFGEKLENIILNTMEHPTSSSTVLGVLLTLFIIFTAGTTILVTIWWS
ncbi:Alpha-1,3-mannosyltransferase-like protein [Coemansia spiralis]|uniref:Alpha-1,3/1,6-mannosyltransferase ALG2 n=2 Tax=Coemansia TaxID=4863 RepID=A0A9W8G6J8_9FUNG|nr:hypothetical protein BX070DRAFT_226853 [Coemansia spiralis]KAJ1990916.1 Alpha-1,3-mannosyltransferase-like protein [Coemansia umbellata]KAJ2621695.1 Alpha-1,3-mannosyltransferase-like protein [Coemansia sp. RSA 1358]KAJ2676842.1 Alpha-1,3-mannosyltransferase-like protein [Coemansia spiralis]